MAALAGVYHSTLQQQDLPSPDAALATTHTVLASLMPSVRPLDKALLATYITRAEVCIAMKDLPSGKAAGLDGLPVRRC
jgi:hypothetical protein